MLLTRDEILRVGGSAKPSRSPSASPSTLSSASPSASPSASFRLAFRLAIRLVLGEPEVSAVRASRKRFGLRRWTASLTWKAAGLHHGHVLRARRAARRPRACLRDQPDRRATPAPGRSYRLDEAVQAYEAGNRLPPSSGIDPPGLPKSLRELAVSGRARHDGRCRRRVPHDVGGRPRRRRRALAVQIDYAQGAATIEDLDRAILGSSALAIGATLLVGAFGVDPGDPAAAHDRAGGPADQRGRPGRAGRRPPDDGPGAIRRTRWPRSPPRSTPWRPRCSGSCSASSGSPRTSRTSCVRR